MALVLRTLLNAILMRRGADGRLLPDALVKLCDRVTITNCLLKSAVAVQEQYEISQQGGTSELNWRCSSCCRV